MDSLEELRPVHTAVVRRVNRSAEVAQAVNFVGVLTDELSVISAAIDAIDGWSVRVRGQSSLGLKRRLSSQAHDLYLTYCELNRQIDALHARFPEIDARRPNRTA